ncbi:MAG: hypothetical protein U1D99_04135 [Candidatus Omnitrophota bacterium]|nr:hypothetical protein [Candidatus Omnitrophota bacterium]
MSSKTPKTGLAGRMRDWMCGRAYKFTCPGIAGALGIPEGQRDQVHKALQDFVARGEVAPLGADRRCKAPVAYFAYNPSWHRRNKGVLNKRIYKAMWVCERFTVSDIVKMADAPDRSYVDRIIRRLRVSGYLQQAGRKLCDHGAGAERIYHLADRDRFRTEVMG